MHGPSWTGELGFPTLFSSISDEEDKILSPKPLSIRTHSGNFFKV